MRDFRDRVRWFAVLWAFAAGALMATVPAAEAGGPLYIVSDTRQPVRWSRSPVINPANPNLQTVDAQGRVLYRVDLGSLGPLNNERAKAFVDQIFSLYSNIPTSVLRFVNAGPIVDPDSGEPVDVNGRNFGKYLSSKNPTYQNPIIFDSDGEITGDSRTLGFFTFLQMDEENGRLLEGTVVLNGGVVSAVGEVPFFGVFTHEFGHFVGPLDHAQVNGNIGAQGLGASSFQGFGKAQLYDLYMPFMETMFPFFIASNQVPSGSLLLAAGFGSNGFYSASLDMDTSNALSNLYPTAEYLASRGSIQGRVVIRTEGGDIPLDGMNVVARRIGRGVYPPLPGTVAYTGSILTDDLGIPIAPPDQDATDPLRTASSAVTGLDFGKGTYQISGLPPGDYLIEVQQVNPDAVAGSSIGPLASQFPLTAQEFYNGLDESNLPTDTPLAFVPVTVSAGAVTDGIDIVLNGLSSAAAAPLAEQEPNEKTAKAQRLNAIPVELTGRASDSDPAKLRVSITSGSRDGVEDLYRFTVSSARSYYILLEPTSGVADLDLYLFDSGVNKKKVDLDDRTVIGFSGSESSNEVIAMRLDPGTYIIGVSAFEGSQSYRLRVIPSL